MTLFIDLHCHLDHYYFKEDIDKVIERAKSAGLKFIVTSGINPETNKIALDLCKKYDILKPSLGIYPITALQKEIDSGDFPLKKNIFDIDKEIEFIKKNKKKIVAVGEVGLDYLWEKKEEQQKNQKELFEKMIALAESLKKPIVIHSRKAERDCIDMLESSTLKKVILHCFCGKKKLVERAEDNGWYFTIPTNVTRSEQMQSIVRNVSLSQLFCETDSPYLSPFKDEKRKRNEPSFVIESYKKIAEVKGLVLEEVEKNIFMNWQKVFE
jgi:TatD DNase family protein